MNKERRNKISETIKKIEDIMKELLCILSDEENVFDNMPENLQNSMRGSESEEAIDIISETIDSLQTICDSLEEI